MVAGLILQLVYTSPVKIKMKLLNSKICIQESKLLNHLDVNP